ncbi:MAG: hypothetical protein QNL80_15145, partial [Akkermansiaceae bacterium]
MALFRPHFILALATLSGLAQEVQNDLDPLPSIDPIAQWTFDQPGAGSLTGRAKIESNSLIRPEYPTFPAKNKSLALPGHPAAWRVRES